jgi:hypothetical protein
VSKYVPHELRKAAAIEEAFKRLCMGMWTMQQGARKEIGGAQYAHY